MKVSVFLMTALIGLSFSAQAQETISHVTSSLMAQSSLANAGPTKIYNCIKALSETNPETFPGNNLTPKGSIMVLPLDEHGDDQTKVVFLSKTTIACAAVPANQGVDPHKGNSVVQIDPTFFGVPGRPFLTRIVFTAADDTDEDESDAFGVAMSVGNGGPAGAQIYLKDPTEFNVVDLKPQRVDCPSDSEETGEVKASGEALYRWVEAAVENQGAFIDAEVNGHQGKLKILKQKSIEALTVCKSLGNENINDLIDVQLEKIKVGGSPSTPIKVNGSDY